MPRLRRAACALLLSLPLLIAEQAAAATLTASIAADPVEEAPVAITLTGSSETARMLFAFAIGGERACAPVASTQELATGAVRVTPVGGSAVAVGAFARQLTFTPPDDAAYRLCTYLADTIAASPAAVADTPFTVRAPASTLTVSVDPSTYEPAQTVKGRVVASTTASNRELRYGWSTSSAGCSAADPINPAAIKLTAGIPVDTAASVDAGQNPIERLCAYVVELPSGQKEATAEAVSTALAPALLLERWRPVPITGDDDQEDRLRLRWKTHAPSDDGETLEIWDTDPADGDDPVISERLDSDEFEAMDAADDERDVRIRHFLGFRELWWSVGADTPSGEVAWSAVRSLSVVPSPMQRKRVRVNTKFTAGYSTKRPGAIRLRITSSPRARVDARVFYRGRVYWKRKYIEGVGRLHGFDFKQTCSQQGQFTYEVKMRDPYGTKVTKRGHWTTSVSRCAAFRAKEERKRAEEERKRREREEKKKGSSGGGSGGSNCVAGYSPQCLKPGIGDYDCSGGSGDGPNYVAGPVTVTGSDPFGLDSDNDGVGCES